MINTGLVSCMCFWAGGWISYCGSPHLPKRSDRAAQAIDVVVSSFCFDGFHFHYFIYHKVIGVLSRHHLSPYIYPSHRLNTPLPASLSHTHADSAQLIITMSLN